MFRGTPAGHTRLIDGENPTTQELKAVQAHRAVRESGAAADAADPDEQAVHERRADKAAYLSERLAEREASEHDDEER